MQCLYCGAKLGALSSKEFCNKKHQELFREQEAQLSIQRLKEAFSFAGSPTSKSRAGTSVLDSPSSEIPPDPEFTSQDPHGRLLEAPASRTRPEPPRPETPRPETPPANPNVIYCGPASEQRDTPPNAGFVTADEPKATFRLPFYVRRPEAGETAVEAGVADLVPQVVGEAEGRTGFGPVACLTSVDICTVGQPGHSVPKPSLESLYEQLRRPIEDQIRKLAFHVADVPDAVLEAGLIERSREIPVGTNRESAELPIAAAPEPTQELRPLALRPRDPELQRAFAPRAELMPLAAQLSIGPLEPASSMPAMETLPVEAERLMPIPAQGAFQALERRRSARIRHAQHTAADAEVLAPGSALQLQVSLRNLAVETRPAPLAAIPTLAFTAEPEKLEAESYRKAERSYELRPLALRPRQAEPPRAVPRLRDTPLASLPGMTVGLPQVAIAAKTHAALGFAITRETHAALRSAFRTLVSGNVVPAPPQRTASATPCTDASYQKLRAKLRIPSRPNVVQYSKLPLTLIAPQEFAAKVEEPQLSARRASGPIHEIRPPAGLVRPRILGRQTAERPPLIVRYPKVIPASSTAWAPTRQPSTLVAPRPFRPSSDLPVRELPAKLLAVASRELGLPSCSAPLPLAKMQAFVANLGEPETKARSASEPVPERTMPTREVRPMVHRRQDIHLPAVVAPHTETTPAILPRLAAPPPQVALPRASQVLLRAIGRLSAALPGSGFESLGAERRAPAQRPNRAITPAADWSAHKLKGKPVQVEARKLALDERGVLSGQPELPFAPILETLDGKMCRASVPTFEAQPIAALKKRKIDRQPAVAVYSQPILAELKRLTVSGAALATIRTKNAHKVSVTGRAALTPPISSFQALPEGAPSLEHTWAKATTQLGPTADVSRHVADRRPNFTAQASITREPSAGPGSQFGPPNPEFLVARSDCRIFCPPRPLPSWDPEWLGPQQFVRWPSWMERPARLTRGGIFKQDPAGGSLTLAAAGSASGLIRIAAWTEASETLNQSTLILQLPRREGDAVLVQIRPAPAPPAPASQGPRTAIQTLKASSAPSGAKRQMQWVSVAVPWRPLP